MAVWAGAGSGGAGIAKLRDPDFVLVMGTLEVVETAHLCVIGGGFQKEADLDALERWRRICVRRKNGEDFRLWTRSDKNGNREKLLIWAMWIPTRPLMGHL